MGCLIVLLLGAILFVILSPILFIIGMLENARELIEAAFIWLRENAYAVIGVMLVLGFLVWFTERLEKRSSFEARPKNAKDPEERRLWWLAEQEAKVVVSEWENKTGKRMKGADRKDVTRKLFIEMKNTGAEKGKSYR